MSFNVGALLCLHILALLRFLGSNYNLSVPFALQGYVSEVTQGVGFTCGVMIS